MMRETEDVIRSIGKGLVMKVTIKVRRHPERMWRIYYPWWGKR